MYNKGGSAGHSKLYPRARELAVNRERRAHFSSSFSHSEQPPSLKNPNVPRPKATEKETDQAFFDAASLCSEKATSAPIDSHRVRKIDDVRLLSSAARARTSDCS